MKQQFNATVSLQGGSAVLDTPTQIDVTDFAGNTVQSTQTTLKPPSAFTVPHILGRIDTQTLIDGAKGDSQVVTFGYDSLGNISSKTRTASGVVTQSIQYGSYVNGYPTSVTDGNNHQTTYDYTDKFASGSCKPSANVGAYLTSVTQPNGAKTSFTYNACTGSLSTKTDANGNTTSYGYDSLGRQTSSQMPGGFSNTTDFNDSAPNTITRTELASPDPPIITRTTLDGLGRTSSTITSADEIDVTFDNEGRNYTVTNPGTNDKTIYSYDALNRVSNIQYPDSSAKTSHYYGEYEVTQDEAGSTRINTLDAQGRLVSVCEVSGSTFINEATSACPNTPEASRNGFITGYTYDGKGDLTSVTARNQQRLFSYDAVGSLVTTNNPETGKICYGQWSGSTCQGGYDANGNLLSKTDARGQTVAYSYDALNRITGKYHNGTQVAGYFYDRTWPAGIPNSLGANAIGRLNYMWSSAPVGAGKEDEYFSYDGMGRVVQWEQATPSEIGISANFAGAGYDLAGNMTSLTYPWDARQSGPNLTINQSFDSAGRLTNVYPAGSPQTPFISSISYLPSGTPNTITYGNGLIESFQQNNRLQPCRHTATSGSLQLLDNQYFYNTNDTTNACAGEANNNGSIWHIVDGLPSATENQNLQYDALNRLSSFEAPNMSGAYRSQSFSYDSFGNIYATKGYNNAPTGSVSVVGTPNARDFANPNFPISHVGGHTIVYGGSPYNVNNQLIDDVFDCTPANGTAHYDAAGNIQCDGSNTDLNARQYTWDAESRLERVNAQHMGNTYDPVAVYTYNAAGSRIRADQLDTSGNTVSLREYSFFNGQMLAEKDQNGAWTNYIYANGQKIAKLEQKKPILHIRGTRTDTNSLGTKGFQSGFTGIGLVIAQGDKLSFDFAQNQPSAGGLQLTFTDNSNTGSLTDASTGVPLFANSLTNGWQHLTGALNSYTGRTLANVYAGWHSPGPTGDYDLQYANVVVTHADGSVTPLFTGQAGAAFAATGGAQNISSDTEPTLVGSGEGITYFLADHLGTTQMELSPGGWPVWQGQFAPFGQELDNQTTAMRYKFTGKERDQESGLDYFGARMYASTMGRWMSPDLVNLTEARMMNPSSTLNKYAYGANNPLKYVDPDGQDVVIFYEKGFPGHIMTMAYDPSLSSAATRSFGPAGTFAYPGVGSLATIPGFPVPATTRFDFDKLTSADAIRSKYSSITIKTSPEVTQQVVQALVADSGDKTYTTLGYACASSCKRILGQIKQFEGLSWSYALVPRHYFVDMYNRFGNGQAATRLGDPVFTPGTNYGSYQPSWNEFDVLNGLINPTQQTPQRNCTINVNSDGTETGDC